MRLAAENPVKKRRTFLNKHLELVTWAMRNGSGRWSATYYYGADDLYSAYGETEEEAVAALDAQLDEIQKFRNQ